MVRARGRRRLRRSDEVTDTKKGTKAKVEQMGLSLYGHVAQNEPEAVKSAVAKWLKQLGK